MRRRGLPEATLAALERAGQTEFADAAHLPTPTARGGQALAGLSGFQARVAMMTSKGFLPIRRAVSMVVRPSASAWAAHGAR